MPLPLDTSSARLGLRYKYKFNQILSELLATCVFSAAGGLAQHPHPLDTALISGNNTGVMRLLNTQGNLQAEKDQALVRSLQFAGVLADSTRPLEIAKNLIVNGANINSNPEVVIMGYDLSLRTLVKNRANLNVMDGGNLTPLLWAINKWGSGGTSQEQKAGETTAKTLIQAGARINEKISTHETTVIFEVARFNRPDIVH